MTPKAWPVPMTADDRGLEPEYLDSGVWILDRALLRFTLQADTQADEVDEATARAVAVRLGAGPAVFAE